MYNHSMPHAKRSSIGWKMTSFKDRLVEWSNTMCCGWLHRWFCSLHSMSCGQEVDLGFEHDHMMSRATNHTQTYCGFALCMVESEVDKALS